MIIKKYGKMWLFECPLCKTRGRVDDDQANGRVSIDCPWCEYHDTKNWIKDQK